VLGSESEPLELISWKGMKRAYCLVQPDFGNGIFSFTAQGLACVLHKYKAGFGVFMFICIVMTLKK